MKRTLQNFTINFPFKLNFFVLLVSIVGAYFIIVNADSSSLYFAPLFLGLVKMLLYLIILVVLLSTLSMLLSYIYCKRLLKQNNLSWQMRYSQPEQKSSIKPIEIQFQFKNVILPLWGYLYLRLIFENNVTMPAINLLEKANTKGLIYKDLSGTMALSLPYIKSYNLDKGILYFQDFLRLFSLPLKISTPNHFWNLPHVTEQNDTQSIANKAKDLDVRIPELRKIDGELLQYKSFAPADDTRRIIWKVFAKNRELVVRTPELFNPFASEIVVFASFNNTFINAINWDFNEAFLSFYKQQIANVFQSMEGNGLVVKFWNNKINAQSKDVAKHIASQNWQKDNASMHSLDGYKASVIIVSSAMSYNQILELCSTRQRDGHLFYICLSKYFKYSPTQFLLSKLFLLSINNTYNNLKNKWFWHPFKNSLSQNEKQALDYLQTESNITII